MAIFLHLKNSFLYIITFCCKKEGPQTKYDSAEEDDKEEEQPKFNSVEAAAVRERRAKRGPKGSGVSKGPGLGNG